MQSNNVTEGFICKSNRRLNFMIRSRKVLYLNSVLKMVQLLFLIYYTKKRKIKSNTKSNETEIVIKS